jgi:WD40 repeat protein
MNRLSLLVVLLAVPPLLHSEVDPEPPVSEPGLRQTLRWGKGGPVAFSSDGKVVAVGDSSGVVQVRRLPGGKLLHTVKTHGLSGRTPSCLTLSPDGKKLAVIASDAKVRLYPLGAKKGLDSSEPMYIEISPLVFSFDGKTLATFSDGHTIRFWEVATGKAKAGAIKVGENCDSLAFSPDGKLIATGHYHPRPCAQLAVWNVATGKKVRNLGFLEARTFALAFSPDGKLVAGADQNGNLKLFDVARGKELHDLKGHTDYITALAFTPDSKTIASGARQKGDSTIRLWDVTTGHQRAVLKCPGGVWSMTFRSDGRILYSSGSNGVLRLWDLPTKWKHE